MGVNRRLAGATAAFVLALALFGFLHSRPGGLVERDGYFHARYAALLPERGLSRAFPWTQASTWRERFWDKELLYHLLLVPFVQGEEPVRGARVFACLLAASVFAAFYLFLDAHGARAPGLWTAALGAMGGPFLLRLSFIRPHTLSVLLAVAGLHLLVRERARAMALLGFALAWSYSVPFVLPALAVPYALGRWAGGARLDWRTPAAALGGALAGLLVHPYFPNSLEALGTYAEVLRQASGGIVEVGTEFRPYSTRAFLQAFPLPVLSLAALGWAGWRAGRRLTPESLGLLAAAWAGLLATMVYLRAIEYAAPLTAAAAAFAARDLLDAPAMAALKDELRRRPWRVWAGAAACALALGAGLLRSAAYAAAMSAGEDPPRFRRAAGWMAANLEPGETLAQLWWDDFPDLFYDGHRQRYLVALDPSYLLRWDREKAAALERMRTGRAPLDAGWLAATFGARYLILRAPSARLYPQLASGWWRPVYLDPYAAIYALSGPDGPPPELRGALPMPSLP